MIAVDTQVLVNAARTDAKLHARARDLVIALRSNGQPWGIPSPCVSEYLRVTTHPAVFRPPSTPDKAAAFIDDMLDSGGARLLLPGGGWWRHLRDLVATGRATGNLVFDAQIAAVCLDNGAGVLITDDTDFGRFPLLRTARLDTGEWRKWVK
jgi:toxin-antitoxin system PIN domain toxin